MIVNLDNFESLVSDQLVLVLLVLRLRLLGLLRLLWLLWDRGTIVEVEDLCVPLPVVVSCKVSFARVGRVIRVLVLMIVLGVTLETSHPWRGLILVSQLSLLPLVAAGNVDVGGSGSGSGVRTRSRVTLRKGFGSGQGRVDSAVHLPDWVTMGVALGRKGTVAEADNSFSLAVVHSSSREREVCPPEDVCASRSTHSGVFLVGWDRHVLNRVQSRGRLGWGWTTVVGGEERGVNARVGTGSKGGCVGIKGRRRFRGRGCGGDGGDLGSLELVLLLGDDWAVGADGGNVGSVEDRCDGARGKDTNVAGSFANRTVRAGTSGDRVVLSDLKSV